MYDAALDADALMLVTEWKVFRIPNWGVMKRVMNKQVVFDGRNIFDSDELREYGFVHYNIGKK